MNLYILKPIVEITNPYDIYMGFVIYAHDETEARQVAENRAKDCKPLGFSWLSATDVACDEIVSTTDNPHIVLEDFNGAWHTQIFIPRSVQ